MNLYECQAGWWPLDFTKMVKYSNMNGLMALYFRPCFELGKPNAGRLSYSFKTPGGAKWQLSLKDNIKDPFEINENIRPWLNPPTAHS